MNKFFPLIAITFASLSLASLTFAQARTFTNPLFPGQDPYVTFWNGNYYYTESGNNEIKIRKSPTLTGLKSQTDYIAWTSPWIGPDGHANLWAPEIHLIDGTWYIYFSADFQSNGQHRIYVLKGGSDPLDPYTVANTGAPQGQLTESTGQWAIDPDVFYGGDGQLYIVWSCTANSTGTPPQNICLARMSDALHISSPTAQISSPTQDWETRTGPINEGPVGFVHNGSTYITYSASASWTPNDYAVGVLINSAGSLLDTKSWEKHGPIFDHHGTAYGPGSVVFTPSADGTELWNVYHGYDSLNCAAWACRSIRAGKVQWDAAGLPLLGYPVNPGVLTRTPAGDTGSPTGWGDSAIGAPAEGVWNYRSAGSLDTLPGGTNSGWLTFRPNINPISYTASATIQVDGGATGQFGIYPVYRDSQNFVEAYLDTQQGMFVSTAAVAGQNAGLRSYPLPSNFDPAAAHTLQVNRSADAQFSFYLDGVFMDNRAISIADGPVAITASASGVHFSGIAVSDTSYGWGDAFGDLAEGTSKNAAAISPTNGFAQGNWKISNGATVESSSADAGWSALYQGSPNFRNHTVQVDAQLLDPGNPADPPRIGLIACYDDRDNQLNLWVDPTLNVLTWNAIVQGVSASQSISLPAGFDPLQSHRLAATKAGSLFTFFLDGEQMAQATFALANGTAGVIAENAHAKFQNYSFVDR